MHLLRRAREFHSQPKLAGKAGDYSLVCARDFDTPSTGASWEEGMVYLPLFPCRSTQGREVLFPPLLSLENQQHVQCWHGPGGEAGVRLPLPLREFNSPSTGAALSVACFAREFTSQSACGGGWEGKRRLFCCCAQEFNSPSNLRKILGGVRGAPVPLLYQGVQLLVPV